MTPTYCFRNEWSMPHDRGRLFAVLADIAGYPSWWREVRAVAKVDDDTAHVVCRSVLPYALDLTLTRVVEDPRRGVLEARLEGDLDGWSRWTLHPEGTGTVVHYDQQVTTTGRPLTFAARLARPVLVLNHAWMMRSCRRALLNLGRAQDGNTPR